MSFLKTLLTFCVLITVTSQALARSPNKNERDLCTWGAGMAGTAQQYKLSGLTLYGARKKMQAQHFAQQWMRMSALGITEQTYDSPSKLRPESVKQVYYEGCIKHEVARR
ncbi:Valyl-tRNA synthetase [Pseudomonas sp. NZIPFR-PS5]|nr:Valyl-tRNA synthetase [Pseudomonas sp. NZIPFR-PS5]